MSAPRGAVRVTKLSTGFACVVHCRACGWTKKDFTRTEAEASARHHRATCKGVTEAEAPHAGGCDVPEAERDRQVSK